MHNKKYNNKSNTFIQGLRPFSRSLPHGLKKLLKKGNYNFSNIIDNWVKMVGKDLSNACYPSTVKMGKEMNNYQVYNTNHLQVSSRVRRFFSR